MPRDEDFEQFLESFQRTGFIVMKPNFAPLTSKTNFCSIFDKKIGFRSTPKMDQKRTHSFIVNCMLQYGAFCCLWLV